MKEFNGFPSNARMEFTPIPNVFFSDLLAGINDMNELKTALHVMAVLYRKKGYPRYVSFSELMENASLMQALHGSEESLREALKKAVATGTLLSLTVAGDSADENVYFLNDDTGRQALAKIDSGELKLPPGFRCRPKRCRISLPFTSRTSAC
jgi:hypothetical protein